MYAYRLCTFYILPINYTLTELHFILFYLLIIFWEPCALPLASHAPIAAYFLLLGWRCVCWDSLADWIQLIPPPRPKYLLHTSALLEKAVKGGGRGKGERGRGEGGGGRGEGGCGGALQCYIAV